VSLFVTLSGQIRCAEKEISQAYDQLQKRCIWHLFD